MSVPRSVGRLWPRNLTGRTVLVLLVSLTALHIGSLWMHQHELHDRDAVASTTVMAIGIVAIAMLLVRWLTGPRRRLAQAADGIGRRRVIGVPQDGPEEVQRVARALDAMQTRITRLVDDRTQALAAVSRDLRTPLTRMRLRTGFLDDPEVQAQMEADLDKMEGMIAATLAYLQGEAETEKPQLTDIGAMLSTLCNAADDAGGASPSMDRRIWPRSAGRSRCAGRRRTSSATPCPMAAAGRSGLARTVMVCRSPSRIAGRVSPNGS